jgi:hypothetical protein
VIFSRGLLVITVCLFVAKIAIALNPSTPRFEKLYEQLLVIDSAGSAQQLIWDEFGTLIAPTNPIKEMQNVRQQRLFIDSMSIEELDLLPDAALRGIFDIDKGRRFKFNSEQKKFNVEESIPPAHLNRWKQLLFESHIHASLFQSRMPQLGQFFANTILAHEPNRLEKVVEKFTLFPERHPIVYGGGVIALGVASQFGEQMGLPQSAQEGMPVLFGGSLGLGLVNGGYRIADWYANFNRENGRTRSKQLEEYGVKNGLHISLDLNREMQAARLRIPANFANLGLFHLFPEHFDEIYELAPAELSADLNLGTGRKAALIEGDKIPVWIVDPEKKMNVLKAPPALLAAVKSEPNLSQARFEHLMDENLPKGGYWIRMPDLDPNTMFYFHPEYSKKPFSTRFSAIEIWERPYSASPTKVATFPASPDEDHFVDFTTINERIKHTDPEVQKQNKATRFFRAMCAKALRWVR